MKYYSWTIGCQMNRAETSEICSYLQSLGMQRVNTAREADIVVINTCVVRQNAEDKVVGMLGYLKGIKREQPGMRIALTGCFVDSDIPRLNGQFPHVNCYFKPGETGKFEDWLCKELIDSCERNPQSATHSASTVSAYIPIIQGCNNFCSYCIVPFRRGRERSRPATEILYTAKRLIANGAREIVLVGQNVNAYGKDLEPVSDLAALLRELNDLTGLLRIRFLTNHPKDMSPGLIDAMLSLDKVCHHVCLPLQAGDDQILKAMNRHYTLDQYKSLIDSMRHSISDIALSTDLIVGFPGETEEQYLNTVNAVKDIRFDVVHVAYYSPRIGTFASERLIDDVPYDAKLRRLHEIESLQTEILSDINQQYVGSPIEILVEGRKGGKWYGRTVSDKLVFFEGAADFKGSKVTVNVKSASPWALQGTPVT
jgi:tRNA-2-methylthio-N6-dimethylallyladenosine synthase